MAKSIEQVMEGIEWVRNDIYHRCLTKYGKKTLVTVYKIFFKGGYKNENYFSYLKSNVNFNKRHIVLNENRIEMIKKEHPIEYDFTALHFLLQSTASLYDGKNHGLNERLLKKMTSIENGIDYLVIRYLDAINMASSLKASELEKGLVDLSNHLGRLLYQAAEYTGFEDINHTEYKNIFDEIYYGVLDYSPSKIVRCIIDNDMAFAEELKEVFEIPDISLYKKEKVSKGVYMYERKSSETVSDKKFKITTEQSSKEIVTEVSQELSGLNFKKKTIDSIQKLSSKDSGFKKVDPSGSRLTATIDREPNQYLVSNEKNTVSDFDKSDFTLTATTYAVLNYSRSTFKNQALTRYKPSVVYTATDVLFKQGKKYSLNPGSVVNLKDVLTVKAMDRNIANFIIVSGDCGMGKTMLLKYIFEKWGVENEAIQFLNKLNFMFYVEMSQNTIDNFHEYAKHILRRTIEKRGYPEPLVIEMVLEFHNLMAFDNYEAATNESLKLMKEVLCMNAPHMKILITCRPQYVDTIYTLIPNQKKSSVSHLSLNGIPEVYRPEFIKLSIATQFPGAENAEVREKITEGLIKRLPKITTILGEDLNNPRMLNILISMWIEHPIIELNKQKNKVIHLKNHS